MSDITCPQCGSDGPNVPGCPVCRPSPTYFNSLKKVLARLPLRTEFRFNLDTWYRCGERIAGFTNESPRQNLVAWLTQEGYETFEPEPGTLAIVRLNTTVFRICDERVEEYVREKCRRPDAPPPDPVIRLHPADMHIAYDDIVEKMTGQGGGEIIPNGLTVEAGSGVRLQPSRTGDLPWLLRFEYAGLEWVLTPDPGERRQFKMKASHGS